MPDNIKEQEIKDLAMELRVISGQAQSVVESLKDVSHFVVGRFDELRWQLHKVHTILGRVQSEVDYQRGLERCARSLAERIDLDQLKISMPCPNP